MTTDRPGPDDPRAPRAQADARSTTHPDTDPATPTTTAARRRKAARAARAARRGAGASARGVAASARLVNRGGRTVGSRARAYVRSSGAGESGLARLVELHFVNVMADAALTVSLAGTIFAIPTGEARSQVAQFLLLTMAPFAVLAPFIGPLLDRFRHGRRWAIGTTLALRGFLCWVLAGAITHHSAWLFPCALGCLVASKAYGVTKSAAVPRLLPPGFTLVNANSRNGVAGVVGMAVGGGLAGAASRVGPDWSLRLAFVIYVVGTVLAIRLPARVDSSAGERDIKDSVPIRVRAPLPARSATPTTPTDRPAGGGLRDRVGGRVAALPTSVLVALWSAVGARLLTGFLTLFMAFLTREHPLPGMSGTFLLALVVGAAGVGNALGTVLGNLLRRARPEVIIAAALVADVVVATATATFYSVWTLLALGLTAALGSTLIKLGFDALVQTHIEDSVRTRVFAWSETTLQIAWVLGGVLGISLPLDAPLGFGVISGVLALVLLATVRVRLVRRHATTS